MCRAQTELPSNVAGEVAWDVEDVPLSGATALLSKTMLHNDHMPMIKVTVTHTGCPGSVSAASGGINQTKEANAGSRHARLASVRVDLCGFDLDVSRRQTQIPPR